MIFSKSAGYALQTVIYLSNYSKGNPVSQQELSNSLNIPFHYLGKILQPLTKNNIIDSKKGGKGGFYLTKSPKEIVLCDIVNFFGEEGCFEECIIGFPGCSDSSPCPLHDDWKPAKIILQNILQKHTIDEWNKDLSIKLDYIKKIVKNTDA